MQPGEQEEQHSGQSADKARTGAVNTLITISRTATSLNGCYAPCTFINRQCTGYATLTKDL